MTGVRLGAGSRETNEAEQAAHRDSVLHYPRRRRRDAGAPEDAKEQSGFAHRDDILSFVDYIDADEKRI